MEDEVSCKDIKPIYEIGNYCTISIYVYVIYHSYQVPVINDFVDSGLLHVRKTTWLSYNFCSGLGSRLNSLSVTCGEIEIKSITKDSLN